MLETNLLKAKTAEAEAKEQAQRLTERLRKAEDDLENLQEGADASTLSYQEKDSQINLLKEQLASLQKIMQDKDQLVEKEREQLESSLMRQKTTIKENENKKDAAEKKLKSYMNLALKAHNILSEQDINEIS